MLVQMEHSRGVQYAYTKRSWSPLPCGVCKCAIIPTMLYTIHLTPGAYVDPTTNRKKMFPYVACEKCAPFVRLEQQTGELRLDDWIKTEREEAQKPIYEQRTELEIPAIRVRSVVQGGKK